MMPLSSKRFRILATLLIAVIALISRALISPNAPSAIPPSTESEQIPTTASVAETVQQKPASTLAQNLYKVTRVIDGDTIEVRKILTRISDDRQIFELANDVQKVRLIGIDTPETVDPRKPVQCFGKEASAKAKELLEGKNVRIETDSSQGTYDRYKRLLAYVFLENGTFFNKYMIEQGYAHEYTYDLPYWYQKEFKDTERLAREAEKGLWNPAMCNGKR